MQIFKARIVGAILLIAAVAAGSVYSGGGASGEKIDVCLRTRAEIRPGSGAFGVVQRKAEWKASETAIIICDMWNEHWCKGATARVGELAVRINEAACKARGKGVFIIHAPSDTMKHYAGHPARKRAAEVRKAANLPADIGNWCTLKSDFEQKFEYPIDQSDGGCDCREQCAQRSAWTSQIDTIEIHNEDAVSDSGAEIWSLLEDRGIKNVILMGVHTNMCVLGRPFGLRNLARYGKNVVLARDLTDTMYNSRKRPFVNHFTGTDLIVEHIEKFVCPTITSTALTGRGAFTFKADKRGRVVFISAEKEYGAVESLPAFSHELEMKYGLCCEVVQGSPLAESAERHWISGMEALADADLAVIFVRRRVFPAEQMKYLKDYLARGKGLIGLRTASHAFDARGEGPKGHIEWPKFDSEVLGGNYHGHYGSGPIATVTAASGVSGHAILTGVQTPFTSTASLYEVRPLAKSTEVLLVGSISDKTPEPIAWTNKYGKSRVFYSSLGSAEDFKNQQFRKMLVNAVFWAMDKPLPKDK
ncbi:MAG: ThuA domain-containing protein [Sedimentisphaerales bacterium]|nr:ThuA domain-containing protein [Sedimentisphaerales bacterium]